jgi:hypothetical protein
MGKTHSAIMMCLIALCGCNLLPSREPRHVDPALSMSMSRDELVDYLNKHYQGVGEWRDIDTTLGVHMPNGIYQRLSGTIACKAPNQFRLTASNFMAQADFGANSERCWIYVKPGDNAVLTWNHADASLLQHMPVQVPRIDPEWLMLVLGVTPLVHEDYELANAPTGSRELWLTAIEDNYDGRPLRRVVKVDTVRGVVREHAIYDSERNPLVRALLSRHRPINGHVMPQVVQLKFPQLDTELKLTFSRIETDCQLNDGLWALPRIRNTRVVDLGEMMRSQMASQYGRPQPPHFATGSASRGRAKVVSMQGTQRREKLPDAFGAWGDDADAVPNRVRTADAFSNDSIEWSEPARTTDMAEPDWDDTGISL